MKVKLKELVEARKGMEDAHFWADVRDANAKREKENEADVGIKVISDKFLPEYFYYLWQYLHLHRVFKPYVEPYGLRGGQISKLLEVEIEFQETGDVGHDTTT